MSLLHILLAAGSIPAAVLAAPLGGDAHSLYGKRSTSATDVYRYYAGKGTVNWPTQAEWISSFDDLFNANLGVLKTSCTQWNVPNNSADEINNLKAGINTVAGETGVDARYIFAIAMQESNGCVRAPTTNYGVRNPGIMQDHNGAASCNDAGTVSSPCPAASITQMIRDGVAGTSSGDGLVQLIKQSGTTDCAKYYMAARMYNSGSIGPSGDLTVGATATACYASDVANRLTGWVFSKSGCSNGQALPGFTVGTAGLVSALTPALASQASSASSAAAKPTVAASPSPVASPKASPSPSPSPAVVNNPAPAVYSPKASPSPSPSSSKPAPSPTSASPPASTAYTVTKTASYGLAPGVKTGCSTYYTIQAGDYCNKVATAYGITFAQLRALNTNLDANCSNLWQGYDYCVKA